MSTTSDLQDANLDEALVTYEKLQDIEDEMEDVEVEILRQQDKLSKDIYKRRKEVISNIPQFWPLVFEQSPQEIDEYIQPRDSALLLTSLVDLSVERFELPNGDPRSISIKLEFAENEWFEDKILEKKFYWRRAKDSWAGLVSEPVKINWKKDKDLTDGLLDLVCQVWEDEKKGKTDNVEKLKKLMEEKGMGVSFFCWFGFRGRKVTAEEHQEAEQKEAERRKAHKEGKKTEDEEMDEDEDDDEDEYELEVFPTADDVAVCIAEDLYPGAIKYFTNAQEDDLSEIDFEDDSDEDAEMKDDEKNDAPATKKRKA